MPDRLAPGPYRRSPLRTAPRCSFTSSRTTSRGHCTGPQTLEHLVTDVRGGDYSDVFVFSHGWNNDWASATGLYDRLLGGYMDMRTGHGLTLSRGRLRPLLAGVFCPSAALVLPWEEHPAVATGVSADDAVIGAEQQELVEPAQALGLADPFRLYALAQEPASIRLKHIRDGYEDHEYLKFLSGHEMDDQARTIATGLFPRPSRPAGPTPKCGRPRKHLVDHVAAIVQPDRGLASSPSVQRHQRESPSASTVTVSSCRSIG